MPVALRPVLPVVKAAAVAALIATANRRGPQRLVGAALCGYYLAAVTFHVRAGDGATDIAPAAVCALLAASLVGGVADPAERLSDR